MPRKKKVLVSRGELEKTLKISSDIFDRLIAAGVLVIASAADEEEQFDLDVSAKAHAEFAASFTNDLSDLKARATAADFQLRITKAEMLRLELEEKKGAMLSLREATKTAAYLVNWLETLIKQISTDYLDDAQKILKTKNKERPQKLLNFLVKKTLDKLKAFAFDDHRPSKDDS